MSACTAYRTPDGLSLMAAEIVHHDDVAVPQRRNEYLFDVEQEDFTVDRAIDEPGRINAIAAKSRQERHRVPVAIRGFRLDALANWSPAP